ncbi:MAG TPA: carbamoyltransferase C-terminal domain-containing protein [Tepidisphaeraceae bacterium]|jgi:carbamoyltransferase|nr:carbamoyltransferase C-terminal domain-containing protein [Tepidisphaeraceae bacterium]
MNVLGLHFGHDAGVSVIRDGRISAFVERERHCRVKHAISLEFANITTAVEAAGLRMEQIDYCAITSTQEIELIIDDPAQFSVSFAPHPDHAAPSTLARVMKEQDIEPTTLLSRSLMHIFYEPAMRDSYLYRHYGHSFPEHRGRGPGDFATFGWLDHYLTHKLWPGSTLGQVARTDFSPLLADDLVRRGFHYPVTVNLAGRATAGYFISHHAAHAASCYYQSGFRDAAIFTHDGYGDATGNLAGMFYWGEESRIFPITPHHIMIGAVYEAVAVGLGLGVVGAPGKMMGLAAYGKPRFFDRGYVGNWYDWVKTGLNERPWAHHVEAMAQRMGYDMQPMSDRERATAAVNVDIAASTQKLFEEISLLGVETLHKVISRMGRRTFNLCLSGGSALNCPSNSRIYREGPFPNLFIEPGCNDSGLAIGAGLYLYHNVFDRPLAPRPPGAIATPYRGVPISRGQVESALHAAKEQIDFSPCADSAEAAARDLAQDRVIGWYEGPGEIGPRALGHRSILADPRKAENWPRVNRLKGRESWRPFAPAILESEASKWFYGAPNPSPYMLFNASIRSSAAPAVTHVDGTSRIQTISRANGEIGRVIELFFKKTGMPMVLNTSFNGPGEPIVETPAEAIRFLIGSTLDALYIDGFRVLRRRP